jgi:hypothetical protein
LRSHRPINGSRAQGAALLCNPNSDDSFFLAERLRRHARCACRNHRWAEVCFQISYTDGLVVASVSRTGPPQSRVRARACERLGSPRCAEDTP